MKEEFIYIGSDHGGFSLKQVIKDCPRQERDSVYDVGSVLLKL